jgi:hypothetical protein
MDDVELLPCPFCGHAPEINASKIDQVSCENPQCFADVVSVYGYASVKEAIAAWNTRTPATIGRAEGLREAAGKNGKTIAG